MQYDVLPTLRGAGEGRSAHQRTSGCPVDHVQAVYFYSALKRLLAPLLVYFCSAVLSCSTSRL